MLWHCWLGHLIHKTRPDITYNVFGGTLNLTQSELNRMKINTRKTKEMVIGPYGKKSTTAVVITSNTVDRVSSYKLLGVMVNTTLKWDDHVAAIKSKAAKRLWVFKKLKRAGASVEDLIYYYQAVIRAVLEYACPAWHSCLTKRQWTIQDVQRRALQIITNNISYKEACHSLNTTPSAEKRLELCQILFTQIVSDKTLRASLFAASQTWYSADRPIAIDEDVPHSLRYAKTNNFKQILLFYVCNEVPLKHCIYC